MSVIGCGYLGAVHAAAMAKLGHDVIGIDVDTNKIEALQAGHAPFFEPGLPELLLEAQETGRLTFSNDPKDASGSKVHFVCVGTPQKKGEYRADMRFVDAAFDSLLPYLNDHDVVVGKSTVPVGTASRLNDQLKENSPKTSLIWNPEFLREGHAVHDTLSPDRLVYGVPDGDHGRMATIALDEVYQNIIDAGTPRLVMSYATAELVKAAANSFLATKISFINAMAEICDATGGDVGALADAIGLDERIGRKFLNAGAGFGGGCLPKDIRAFMARAGELGADQALTFLREVDAINMRRRTKIVEMARAMSDGSLLGKRILVLGAAFKPNSDDVRDSPVLSVAAQLQLSGANVVVTDPEALLNASRRFPELEYVADTETALKGTDLLVLCTEWQEYKDLDPVAVKEIVSQARILDARNVLDSGHWRSHGWTYKSMGRP